MPKFIQKKGSCLVLVLMALVGMSLKVVAARRKCIELAVSKQHDSSWLAATSSPNSRVVPDLGDKRYGWGDWPEDKRGVPQAVTSNKAWLKSCPLPSPSIARFKVYNGTIWTDSAQKFSCKYEVLEMLMLTLWLYKGLPNNMDIMFSCADHVVECDIQAPIMQTTVVDGKSTVDGQDIDADLRHLVYPLVGTENRDVTYTHGYTMPYKDAWRYSSLAPSTMRAYASCLERVYGNGACAECNGHYKEATAYNIGGLGSADAWAAARKPQLIWRGSSTGYLKGWGAKRTSDPSVHPNTLGSILWNKRLYAAIMTRPYPWMDVGLTAIDRVSFTNANEKHKMEVLGMLKEVAVKTKVDLEQQSNYQLALSLDGHGAPWRLPKQLLGMSPILKVDSPNKVFFEHWLVAGLHYQPVRYDLSNLAETARQVIVEAAKNSTRLQCMAIAARDAAVEHLNGLAQLDSFAWSLAKLQTAYKWHVQSPDEEFAAYGKKWQPVVHHSWISHGFQHLQQHVMHKFPGNVMHV